MMQLHTDNFAKHEEKAEDAGKDEFTSSSLVNATVFLLVTMRPCSLYECRSRDRDVREFRFHTKFTK